MSFICRSAISTCLESTQNASGTPTIMPATVSSAETSPSSSLASSLVSSSLSASLLQQPSSSPSSSTLPPSPSPSSPPPPPSLSSSSPSSTITTEATISSSESASISASSEASSSSASSSPSTVPNALSSSSPPSSTPVLKTLIIIIPTLIILSILIALIITIYLRRKRRRSRLYGSSGSIFVGSSNRRNKQTLLSKFGLKSGNNRISRLGSKDSLSATTIATSPASPPASETALAPEFASALIPKPENVYEKRGRNTHQRASTVLQFEAMHPHVVLVNEDGKPRESIIIAVDGRNQDCRMVKVLQIDNNDKKKECWWKV